MDEEAKKKAEEEAAKAADPAGEQKPDPANDGGVDHKAELERLKKQLGQAEHTIVELKKDKKKEKEDDDPDDEVDINDEIQKIREESKKEIDKLKVDIVKDSIVDVISSLTSNPDERELIKFIYENRIVKSGYDKQSIQDDLVSAQLLANRPKFEKTISELKRTLESETAKNKGGSAAGHNMDTGAVKLSDREEADVRAIAKRHNLSEEVVRAKLILNKKTA